MLKSATPKLPRWQRTRQSLLARQIDISLSAIKLMGYLWWDSTIARRFPHHRNRRAQWLVGTLLDLGPTFIKIGQALSTRGDLLPAEYIQALGQLQDRVPAFSADEAIATIEAELGSPLYTLYRDFDRVPIAAASLGQVHKARLHTGEDVIIKVQRPGLDTLFDLDFKVLRRLLWFAQRYLPWTQEHDLEAIYQEFADVLYQEIDYVQEAINADRFRHNFRDHPRILAPKVYPKYTTKKVLTMDYVPGIKINDRQSLEAIGVNVKEVNQLGICAYLKQLLQDGFFQADPHPGNMAVSLDGSLIFYDFGMMAEVKAIDKDQMIRTFFAVLRKDTDQVISTLTAMGLIETVSDMTPIRRVMGFVLERFTEKPVALQEFSQVRQEVSALFAQQPFRLPPKMTFILKALTTLDGVARDLDPQYSLMESAKPFVKSMTLAKGQPGGFGELTRQARDYITYKLRQPSATERLIQQLEARLEQGEQELRARSLDTDRALKTIHLAIRTLTYACLTGFTLLSAAVLLVGGYKIWAFVAFGLTGLGALASVRALIRLSIRERIDRLVK